MEGYATVRAYQKGNRYIGKCQECDFKSKPQFFAGQAENAAIMHARDQHSNLRILLLSVVYPREET